jgi:hypothetical protein
MLNNYDKLMVHGSFCLLKNNSIVNNVFRNEVNGKLKFKEVFSDKKHRGFDEYGDEAFNSICMQSGLRIYSNNLCFADINSWKKHFVLTFVRRVCSIKEIEILEDEISEVNNSTIFVFNKGKLIRKYIRFGKLNEKEYMYVHFQKRKMKTEAKIVCEKFLMIPNSFQEYTIGIDLTTLKKLGRKRFISVLRVKRQIYIKTRMFIKKNFGI